MREEPQKRKFKSFISLGHTMESYYSFFHSLIYSLIIFSSSSHLYWTMLSTGGTTTKRKKKNQIQSPVLTQGKSKSYSEQNKEKEPWKLRSWGHELYYRYCMVLPEGRPLPSPPGAGVALSETTDSSLEPLPALGHSSTGCIATP